jgi:Flp pilus assembly protein TadG
MNVLRNTFGRRSRGQGIVEFAMIAPIFLMLILGTIEFSWFIFHNHSLNSATREGARYAMVHGARADVLATDESVGAVVQERATFLSGAVVTNVTFDPDPEPGSRVTVSTTYDYVPIIGGIVGVGSVQLTSSSTVIVQF